MIRLRLASFLDRVDSKIQRHAERLNPEPAWFREFRDYLGDPRMTIEEFWIFYAQLRKQEVPKMRAITTAAEARDFFSTSEYPLWRNLVHRRHSAWRRVLWTMNERHGEFLEFGCGIAPISAYVRRARPKWYYWLNDIQRSPHLAFAKWRVQDSWWGENAGTADALDVMTLIDVLEHLSDPLVIAKRAVKWLRPGGYLHWNFVETDGTQLDLATAEQREATMAYLNAELRPVYARDGYYVSRRP